jgi:predicted metal-dependent peptidase
MTLIAYVDATMSMSDYDMTALLADLQERALDANADTVNIVGFDSCGVYDMAVVQPHDIPDVHLVLQGGGSTLEQIWKDVELRQLQDDTIVIYTDGYMYSWGKPGTVVPEDVTFVSLTDAEFPFGRIERLTSA